MFQHLFRHPRNSLFFYLFFNDVFYRQNLKCNRAVHLQSQKRRKHPVPVRRCRTQTFKCQFFSSLPAGHPIIFHFLFYIGKCSCKNQLFFCPGKSNIKYTQLLSQTVQYFLFLNYLFYDPRTFCSAFQIHRIQPDSQPGMQYHTASGVLKIKAFSHACHDHDRELQPLTFVDRHNPHRIRLFIFHACLTIIHVVLLKLFNVSYKMEQSFVASTFEGSGFLNQHLKVRAPLASSRHGGYKVSIPGFFQYLPQKLMHRCIWNNYPEPLHLPQTSFQLFPDLFLCTIHPVL